VIDASTSLEDVAGAVAASLREIGLDPVVVGGSASTLHAPEAYRSRDVDMVFPAGIDGLQRPVRHAMERLGFLLQNNMFVHRASPFTVDFLPGPSRSEKTRSANLPSYRRFLETCASYTSSMPYAIV